MKPSRMQYFFAQKWLSTSFSVGFPLVCSLTAGSLAYPRFILTALGLVVGSIFGVLLSMFIVGPLHMARAEKNGAPFRDGDMVHILAGRYRDRVARVYEVWESRAQVKVSLGEKARFMGKDIFSFTQVCREGSAEQDAAPNGGPATQLGNSGVTERPPSVS
jgi:hypothetical protein